MPTPTDRRTFLASTAGALLAPALVRTAHAGHAPAPAPVARRRPRTTDEPRIRKALKYAMIQPGDTVRDKFLIARDAGFDGIEMDSPNDLDTDDVLRAKEDSGLAIPGVVDSVHWSKPLTHPDPRVRAEGRFALERAILDCKAYAGTSVLLVPGVVNREVSYAQAWERAIDEVVRVTPTAIEAGVSIAFENVWNNFLLSPLEAARFVDTIRDRVAERRGSNMIRQGGGYQPLIGWHLDLGNIVNDGWPEHWIEALGSQRILKLDIKDFSRAKRDNEGLWKGFNVKIGEGDVNWPDVARMLHSDPAGSPVNDASVPEPWIEWAAAEVPGGDLDRLKDISARMDRVLAFNKETTE